jgi:branched-chain amino acid transport system permease protein
MAVLRPAGEFDTSYAEDMATIRRPWQWVLLFVVLAALYTLPLFASQSIVALVNRICITIIAIQGLNLLTGYTGQISLGQAAFMTTGGYLSALLVNLLGWPFLLSMPAAALGAGLIGLVFGLPSLRVKGFYLVMAIGSTVHHPMVYPQCV